MMTIRDPCHLGVVINTSLPQDGSHSDTSSAMSATKSLKARVQDHTQLFTGGRGGGE